MANETLLDLNELEKEFSRIREICDAFLRELGSIDESSAPFAEGIVRWAFRTIETLKGLTDLLERLAVSSPVLDDYLDELYKPVQYLRATLQGVFILEPKSILNDLEQICEQSATLCARVKSMIGDRFNVTLRNGAIISIGELPVFSLTFQQISTEIGLYRARGAVESAESAAEATKKAAGQTADIKLGQHYYEVSQQESASAKWFRVAAISLFAIGIVAAAIVGYVIITDHAEGFASQLFKFLLTLPFLALALWCSHESHNHRMVARRAKEVEVRLYTLEAFLAPLEPQQRAALRAKVGESLLVGPLALSSGTEKQALDAQAIIEKLIDKAG